MPRRRSKGPGKRGVLYITALYLIDAVQRYPNLGCNQLCYCDVLLLNSLPSDSRRNIAK